MQNQLQVSILDVMGGIDSLRISVQRNGVERVSEEIQEIELVNESTDEIQEEIENLLQ